MNSGYILTDSASSRISDYIALSKPGILAASLLTTLTGYMMALPRGTALSVKDITTLFHTLLGTMLVAVGAGALNMLLEIDVDSLMERTKNRPLPQGRVSTVEAFILGTFCSSFGIVHLCSFVNLSSGFFAALTLVIYLVFYTPMKERSFSSIFVGAISGALPPMIGWSAYSGYPTMGAWTLFLIMLFWQFPHFLALSWRYREDYRRANLKVVLESDEDGFKTSTAALITSLALSGASFLPIVYNLCGKYYILAAMCVNCMLLFSATQFLRKKTNPAAKQLFLTTIAYIPLLFLFIILF